MHMANRERGEYDIKVGDKSYRLFLGTNGMAEVEEVSGGRKWEDILIGMSKGNLLDSRLVIWAALREYHSDIATDGKAGLRSVGRWIDSLGGWPGLFSHMQAFLKLNSEPETEQKGGKVKRPRKAQREAGAVATQTASPSV